MKFSTCVLLAVVTAQGGAAAAAGWFGGDNNNKKVVKKTAQFQRPNLSISVRDGSFNGVDTCLDPILEWNGQAVAGDVDLTYGLTSNVRPTTDLASLPRSIWGRASTDISGWDVSARAEMNAQAPLNGADLELNAGSSDADLQVRILASAGTSSSSASSSSSSKSKTKKTSSSSSSKNNGNFAVRKLQATKGFDQDNGARVTVTPRVNLETDHKDVEVQYSHDRTQIKVVASAKEQAVTVSQQIDNDNRIAPTVNSNGDISVEWERRLSDDSRLTANLQPEKALDVEWQDAAWTANLNMPLKGSSISGVGVSIKRDVQF